MLSNHLAGPAVVQCLGMGPGPQAVPDVILRTYLGPRTCVPAVRRVWHPVVPGGGTRPWRRDGAQGHRTDSDDADTE